MYSNGKFQNSSITKAETGEIVLRGKELLQIEHY